MFYSKEKRSIPIDIKLGFNYNINPVPYKNAKEAEAGNKIIPIILGKDTKIEIQGRRYPKMVKKRFPGFTKNLYQYFMEYTRSTSIQGLKYVGQQSRPYFERLAWLVFFCTSLYFCINLILQTYIKWNTSPVLVSFAKSPTPVWKIPFAAITICSETKARQTIYNFTSNYHRMFLDRGNMTVEEIKQFSDVTLICENHLYRGGNTTTGYDTIEFLMRVAPQIDELFSTCTYPFSRRSCQNLFTPILTEEGVCYSFNMLDRREVYKDNVFQFGDFMSHGTESKGWTLGEGYKKNTPIDTFPGRAISAGLHSKFILVLRAYEHDLDYVCKGAVQGFKIILHNPAETPRISSQYFRAPLMQEVIVAIKPDMITTSDGLKNYDPHRRQCFFPQERYLAFYRSYTQQNCEVECLTNFTRTKCGCVGFQMPHEEETPICGSGSIQCMIDARDELIRKEVKATIDKEKSDAGVEESDAAGCDCLPGCTSLVYNAETSQADFNIDKMLIAHGKDVRLLNTARMTRVNIFFKEQQFITAERDELFGGTDFLANCGGLLGLFTGFSFLSLVEILYFLSLRLLCNIKRYGRHYWSGSKELMNNDKYDHQK